MNVIKPCIQYESDFINQNDPTEHFTFVGPYLLEPYTCARGQRTQTLIRSMDEAI